MNATTDMPMQATHSSPSSPVRDISASSGRYHPASRPVLPFGWWTAHRDYVIYMLRELSSVFIAIWALRFLVRLNRLQQGEDAYERAVAADRQPGWVLFNLAAFAFALLHAVTWFQLTGVVMSGMAHKVRLGKRRLSGSMVTTGSFAGWALASLAILAGLLAGGRNE